MSLYREMHYAVFSRQDQTPNRSSSPFLAHEIQMKRNIHREYTDFSVKDGQGILSIILHLID